MRVVVDVSALKRLQQLTPQRVGAIVRKLAMDTEAEIKNNFSPNSPSSPGMPPGVDTGNLKNSIVAVKGDTTFTYLVQVGAEYGADLEYGTAKMAARPYVLPAVERVMANLPPDLAEEAYEVR